jgi:hypothetical protein
MPLFVGPRRVVRAFLGTQAVSRAYRGGALAFDQANSNFLASDVDGAPAEPRDEQASGAEADATVTADPVDRI